MSILKNYFNIFLNKNTMQHSAKPALRSLIRANTIPLTKHKSQVHQPRLLQLLSTSNKPKMEQDSNLCPDKN
jgi:hypothetical protein